MLSTQYFIHFNLSIALLGGYITFLFFVDERIVNVTNSTVRINSLHALSFDTSLNIIICNL